MKFISFVVLGIYASFVSAATFKASIYTHPRDESASKYKRNEASKLKHWGAKSRSPRFQQLFQQNNKGVEDDMHQLEENRSGNSPIWVSNVSQFSLPMTSNIRIGRNGSKRLRSQSAHHHSASTSCCPFPTRTFSSLPLTVTNPAKNIANTNPSSHPPTSRMALVY
jgi:hypothetical protein